MKRKNTKTLHSRKSINRSPLRRGVLLIPAALALAWFALLPTARAVTPAPDGGYPNRNTAEGDNALFSLTTGTDNTAIGFQALLSNTAGSFNTANGSGALLKNRRANGNTANGAQALQNNTGSNNTATGASALFSNTTANNNTATGFKALFINTTGFQNTAYGANALQNNTTGGDNTATGVEALFNNTTGGLNTATGWQALLSNTTGGDNTATGVQALVSNTTGSGNTASGLLALSRNTTGDSNTAAGVEALLSNTTGNDNTANGFLALFSNTTGGKNTATGLAALSRNSTGTNNIALGANAGLNLTTGNNNIDIGNKSVAGDSNTIRIGTVGTQTATFIAGIHGVTVASAVGLVVDVNGHLGTVTSSARFKEAIKPMDKASEAILSLQPVTFRYKQELDPDGIPQFGLVAEQVEKVNPDLVVRGEDGKVMTVRYEAVNAMLLNEFLKEHRKVEEQQATIGELKSAVAEHEKLKTTIAQQQKQIEALTATVQKVSDQVTFSKPAPQLVANP